MMARAATANELALLRTPGQWSELYLAIHSPDIVFQARVLQSFSAWDSVVAVPYYGVSYGAYGSILPGMTLCVGSTAGACDKGQARIRKAADATNLYIGETSEVAFTQGDYLTVLDEFGLWPKHWVVEDDATILMDEEIAYTDQHASPDPVPVLGPAAAVLWLTGATVQFQPTASDSWALGSTISSYAWSAPGASATANLNTATPTITYNKTGAFRVSCTVTAANGKTTTGHRVVFVFSKDAPPITQFKLDSDVSGDLERGGWRFSVTMFGEALLDNVRDRAMVVLFARDHYGSVEQSIGPVAGYENVIAVGWIAGETILQSPVEPRVTFTVEGPAANFKAMTGFQTGLEDTSSAPTTWAEFQSLTVDKALWHFLHWRTTATTMMDVRLTGNTFLAPALEAPQGSLWEQLQALAYDTILARPFVDRYGRLEIGIDPQVVPSISRDYPVVQTLEWTDWMDRVEVERAPTPVADMVDLSGISYDGTTTTPLISRSPGHIFKRFGRVETRERLLLDDQDQANLLAGLILGSLNNLYPRLSFKLAANNRLIDIAPGQYCQVDFASEDTLRGFVCSGLRMLPTMVSFVHDPETGFLRTEVDFKAETIAVSTAITIPIEKPPTYNYPDQPPITIPDYPIVPLDPIDYGTIPIVAPITPSDPNAPGAPCRDGTDTSANGPFNLYFGGTLEDGAHTIIPMGFHARPSSAANPTKVTFSMTPYARNSTTGAWVLTGDLSWAHIYLIDGSGNRLSTGVITGKDGVYSVAFDLAAGTDIAGIEILLDPNEWYVEDITVDNAGEVSWGAVGNGNTLLFSYSNSGKEDGADKTHTYQFVIVPPAGKSNAGWMKVVAVIRSSEGGQMTTVPDGTGAQPGWAEEWGIHQSYAWTPSFAIGQSANPFVGPCWSSGGKGSPSGYNGLATFMPPEDYQSHAQMTIIAATQYATPGGVVGPTFDFVDGFVFQLTKSPAHRLVIGSSMVWNICARAA